MMWLDMIFTFMKIGVFSFGGGYAILALIQQEVVLKHGWLTQAQFADIVAISQMTPGPIAVNAATFIGYQRAGILGSLMCTFGVIFPSLVMMLVITMTYLKLKKLPWFRNIFTNLRLLTIGLIGAAMWLIGAGAFTDWFTIAVFVVCFGLYWRFRMNPVYMMLGAALLGIVVG